MSSVQSTGEKTRLHPRNRNRERYDLDALISAKPDLAHHVAKNKYGVETVDFSNPTAVKLLNQALLIHYYHIKNWDFPNENLCPPIPGRADYIHHIADLLAEGNLGAIPTRDQITALDIGVGASCIYPLLGVSEYQWRFIASDINPQSIASAKDIVDVNPAIKGRVDCRLQADKRQFFKGIIGETEQIDFTLCNPPFHSSAEEAQRGSKRKIKNLSGKKEKNPTLNFAGISKELIYKGGEYNFIHQMILESRPFGEQCLWFSSLVSKQANLKGLYKLLKKVEAVEVKTIPMGTGNKSSRILAWTFLSPYEQKEWRNRRWRS